jgi:hypothetical protein
MNAQHIRVEIHSILDRHEQLLVSHHVVQSTMQQAFAAHDAVLVNVIEANRAALRLLTRLIDEGTEQSS